MKKLDPKIYRLRKIMDFTGVIFLVLLLMFIWQLYRGPIEVPFLKPYIIKALNHDDSQYQVTLDSVNIELVRSIKPIKIIANNVDYKKADGSFSISAPKTSLSFSIRALLRGIIAPSSVNVMNPTVYVFTTYGVEKDKKEEINQKKLEYYFDLFDEFIERFNSEDKSYAESYINDIEIENAEVEFHEVDLGRKWVLSDLNYRFDRRLLNIKSELNALLPLEDTLASVGMEAEYRPSKNKAALRFYFSDLIPGHLMNSLNGGDNAKNAYNINLPVGGKIETVVDFNEVLRNRDDFIKSLDSAVEGIRFSFEGGAGSIMFSDKENEKFNVSAFLLEGDIDTRLDTLKIENADLDISGQKAKFSIYVSGVKDYLLKKSLAKLALQIKAEVADLKFDDLYDYWPRFVGTDAWEWCKSSIHGGDARNARFTFDFAYDENEKVLAFKDLNGTVELADASLNYLEGMPDVTNIYGKASFFKDRIKIDFDKGVSDDVLLNGGYVLLYDLDKYDNFAEISLEASSSISDALKLIDHKPLEYASEMGLSPDKFRGQAETKLDLAFELKNNLQPQEVKVNVVSELKDVELPDAIDKQAVKSPQLNLQVNNEGMNITGEVLLDDIPLNLVWNESFASKNYKSKYKLSFKFDEAIKKKLGIETNILNPPYIDGYIGVEADITSFNDKRMQVDIIGNLSTTAVDFSFLGLRKKLGQPGTANVRLNIEDGKLKSIPGFSLSKKDFALKGKIDLDKDGHVKVVDIYDIKAPKTNAKAKIEMANTTRQKVKINVSGSSYDLSEFFAQTDEKIKEQKKRPQKEDNNKDELEDVVDTEIYIAVNSLWTNEFVSVKNFAGSAKLVNGVGIHDMHLIGNFGSGQNKFLKLDYTPRSNGEFLLNVESNDAGGTLKFLRVYDNMRGGTLNISGKREKNKDFIGHAKIRNFSIHNTPVLAKLLTVASFTGMVNLLTGEGITFSHFDAPFEYKNKTLSVKEAKAFGNVMGITANGGYNRRREELNIKGVVAPAYGLNTFIGKLPVVGSLLSGKDGTVFAANYSIKGDISDPDISLNPLSALSPSSLKDLLSSIFGSGHE